MEGTEWNIKLIRHTKDAHQSQEVHRIIKEVKTQLWYVASGVVGAQCGYSKCESVNSWHEEQVGLTLPRL